MQATFYTRATYCRLPRIAKTGKGLLRLRIRHHVRTTPPARQLFLNRDCRQRQRYMARLARLRPTDLPGAAFHIEMLPLRIRQFALPAPATATELLGHSRDVGNRRAKLRKAVILGDWKAQP